MPHSASLGLCPSSYRADVCRYCRLAPGWSTTRTGMGTTGVIAPGGQRIRYGADRATQFNATVRSLRQLRSPVAGAACNFLLPKPTKRAILSSNRGFSGECRPIFRQKYPLFQRCEKHLGRPVEHAHASGARCRHRKGRTYGVALAACKYRLIICFSPD